MINSEIIRIASDTTNNGIKKKSNLIATLKNKTCGDKITIEIEISNNKIQKMSYETEACVFCQASASLLSKIIKKSDIESVQNDINEINMLYKNKKNFLKKNISHLENYLRKNTRKDTAAFFYLLMLC